MDAVDHKTVHSSTERALKCPSCGHLIYPRIVPAVIVGVKNGDKILLTKYRKGFTPFALIAGFTELVKLWKRLLQRGHGRSWYSCEEYSVL